MLRKQIIILLISLALAIPAWAKIGKIPSNYMDGLTDYFYAPKKTWIDKDGTEAWTAFTGDKTILLSFVGNKNKPSLLRLDIVPIDHNLRYYADMINKKNEKIILIFLHNIAPNLKDPKKWVSETMIKAREWNVSQDYQPVIKEIDGVKITVSYGFMSKIINFIVTPEKTN